MSEEIHESLRTASPDAAAMKLVELHRRSIEDEAVYHAACELLARFVADEDGCGSGLEAALHLIRRENETCDEHLVVGTMCDGEFRALEGFGSLEAGKRDGEPANETNE